MGRIGSGGVVELGSESREALAQELETDLSPRAEQAQL
jgi:hypothetical protein